MIPIFILMFSFSLILNIKSLFDHGQKYCVKNQLMQNYVSLIQGEFTLKGNSTKSVREK